MYVYTRIWKWNKNQLIYSFILCEQENRITWNFYCYYRCHKFRWYSPISERTKWPLLHTPTALARQSVNSQIEYSSLVCSLNSLILWLFSLHIWQIYGSRGIRVGYNTHTHTQKRERRERERDREKEREIERRREREGEREGEKERKWVYMYVRAVISAYV